MSCACYETEKFSLNLTEHTKLIKVHVASYYGYAKTSLFSDNNGKGRKR